MSAVTPDIERGSSCCLPIFNKKVNKITLETGATLDVTPIHTPRPRARESINVLYQRDQEDRISSVSSANIVRSKASMDLAEYFKQK